MPFQETRVEDETICFVGDYLSGVWTMTELCERYGISRQWGYELIGRYKKEGLCGLEPRSRAPHSHGRQMPLEIAAEIVELRKQRPHWGPKKLRAILVDWAPERAWPAPSTIGDLLRREGLARSPRRGRRPLPLSRPFAPVTDPNDLWCIDFKGWFRTGDGTRCDPLTLSDAQSRFLLACQIVSPTAAGVAPVVEAALREYGLPAAIRSDNGAPFAGPGAGGLTRLAVTWIKLGIRLERTDRASPEQNARHERLHGTVNREAVSPPAADPQAQQARFDRFQHDYNHIRPHEALDQTTPASHYQYSARPYPERIDEPCYPESHAVRRVRSNGVIKWQGDMIFLSEALAGELVALVQTGTGNWLVRFADVPLAIINSGTRKLIRIAAARPGRRNAEQNKETVNDVSGL